VAFTQQQKEAVGTALVSKITKPCPSCGKSMRQFLQDLYMFASAVPPQPVINQYGRYSGVVGQSPGPDQSFTPYWGSNSNAYWPDPEPAAMPCICVVCMNCGLTEFHNVHVLGLAEALGIPKAGVPIG
jgi:hypothetical protein